MNYLGGKWRIADRIARHVEPYAHGRDRYIEPFAGSLACFSSISPLFPSGAITIADLHEDLILMWKAVREGWLPPPTISLEDYNRLRSSPASALRGYVGFQCSFGGKWFGGYARDIRGRDDICSAAAGGISSLRRLRPLLAKATILKADYYEHDPGPTDLVYCDPPYADTTDYGSSVYFDSDDFWRTAEWWVRRGARVIVSEYQAPKNWQCIATFEKSVTLTNEVGKPRRHEKLFTMEPTGF